MKKLLILALLVPALMLANCPGGQCSLRAKRQVVSGSTNQKQCRCNKRNCAKCSARKRAEAQSRVRRSCANGRCSR